MIAPYTHTSIVLPCEADTSCADCGNPLPKGTSARRRVTDTGASVFREDWICGGICGPIIDDVSDHALMRKRIAELEQELSMARHDREFALELAQQSADEASRAQQELDEAQQERDEIDAELAAERAAHRQTAANLNAQRRQRRGPRAHIVLGED